MNDSATRKPSTIYDVAALAGVSHQTVSRLLLGHEGIRPHTREKVLTAIAELDYRRNVTARNLRMGRTGMISLAIPSLNQPYFASLAQHVIVAARAKGLTVFVETTEGEYDSELEIASGTRAGTVDGTIYAPLALGPADLEHVSPTSPLVLLGDRVLHSKFDHVTMPNVAGARAAVEHLISIGRRRIAVIGAEGPSDYGAATQRLEGYREALSAAEIAFDEALTINAGEWVRAEGVVAMERLLASGTPFDSVFCFNDALALGALRALYRAGLRVPDDVAVVGFDNTEDASFSTPSLTSVSPGLSQIAELAIELLSERMTNPLSEDRRDLLSDFELVVRESTTQSHDAA